MKNALEALGALTLTLNLIKKDETTNKLYDTVKKELLAFNIIKRCFFEPNTDGLAYWIESPLFDGNKLLITKEEYDLLKSMEKELLPEIVEL